MKTMDAPTMECEWFERIHQEEEDLSPADEARYLAHLETCTHHRQVMEQADRQLQIAASQHELEFDTAGMLDEETSDAFVEKGRVVNLDVRVHQNEEPVALVEREGRTIGYLRPGRVIFQKTATLEDRIALVRLLDELDRDR